MPKDTDGLGPSKSSAGSTDPAPPSMTARPKVSPGLYVSVVSLGGVGMTLGIQAVAPGLPELQRVLGLTDSQIGLVTTAYVLPGVFLTLPMGMLGDVVGRRLLFASTLVLSGIAALISGLTGSFPLLLAMRIIQGIAFAAVMPLTITLLGEAFVGARRVRAFVGRNSILTGSDVILPLGGALLAELSWRAPLLAQAVTIPLGIWALLIMTESRVLSFRRHSYARDLARVVRAESGIWLILLAQFSRFAFKFVLLAYLPILLVNERGASIAQVGLVISLSAVVTVVTTTQVPGIIRRLRPSLALGGSVLVIAVSLALFALVPGWRWALAAAVVYGIGDGVIAVLNDMYAMHTARSDMRAGMVSVSQTARNVGKLSSPVAMAALVAVSSLPSAFLIMAVLGLVIAPTMAGLRRMDAHMRGSPSSAGNLGVTAAAPDSDPV